MMRVDYGRGRTHTHVDFTYTFNGPECVLTLCNEAAMQWIEDRYYSIRSEGESHTGKVLICEGYADHVIMLIRGDGLTVGAGVEDRDET